MARSNKGEFYTFPLLLLRLCNNVYWHVWTEHKLQFSSTVCENGTFVKKQTSQFLALSGIRNDIDGKKRQEAGLEESVKEYTQHRCLQVEGERMAEEVKLNTKYIEGLPAVSKHMPMCGEQWQKLPLSPKARPLQWCIHSQLDAHFASPTLSVYLWW